MIYRNLFKASKVFNLITLLYLGVYFLFSMGLVKSF